MEFVAQRLQILSKLQEYYMLKSFGQMYMQKEVQENKILNNSLKDSIEHCRLCQRSKISKPYFGILKEDCKLAFVTQTSLLDAKNAFLETRSAKMLQDIAKHVLKLSQYSLLSLLKCGDVFEKTPDLEICKLHLFAQLKSLQGAIILCFLDEEGLGFFDFQEKDLFGKPLKWQGQTIIFTHSLISLSKNPSLKKETMQHLLLAKGFL